MPGIASAATAVVVGHLAAGTSTIRVGAGGIMLPNHSPLVIAEQFGTLEALYPGRIDLGLGRAPGTDQLTARALRRDPMSGNEFPQDVQDLQFLFGPVQPGPGDPGRAGRGPRGSALDPRLEHVRRPARCCSRPPLRLRLALRADGSAGGTRASIAASSSRRRSSPSRTRWPGSTSSPPTRTRRPDGSSRRRSSRGRIASAGCRGRIRRRSTTSRRTGAPPRRRRRPRCSRTRSSGHATPCATASSSFVELTGVDELMVVSAIFDHDARLRSYGILAEAVMSHDARR